MIALGPTRFLLFAPCRFEPDVEPRKSFFQKKFGLILFEIFCERVVYGESVWMNRSTNATVASGGPPSGPFHVPGLQHVVERLREPRINHTGRSQFIADKAAWQALRSPSSNTNPIRSPEGTKKQNISMTSLPSTVSTGFAVQT